MRIENKIFLGAENKPSLFDLEIPDDWNGELIIFIHGYMGFKDWGCWNLVEEFFVNRNYGFLKYNVSHNGCSTSDPTDFTDLDGFSRNNYSKEIADLDRIIEVARMAVENIQSIILIGHSRGGGIALLQSKNHYVDIICSWAGICDIGKRFPKGDELEDWKKSQLRFVHNSRTNQDLPLHYSQFEDFLNNRTRLNIEWHCRNSYKPTFLIHGENDTSVSIDEGMQIAEWLNYQLIKVPNTEHTFGSSHPWKEDNLPIALQYVCEQTLEFIKDADRYVPDNHRLMSDLIQLAQADEKVRDIEFNFLLAIAKQLRIEVEEFKELFDKYISFQPPKMEFLRILQFHRLMLLMNVDGDSDENEIALIKDLGIRMGLNPEATDYVFKVMHQYENKLIPPKKLMEIFKTYHN